MQDIESGISSDEDNYTTVMVDNFLELLHLINCLSLFPIKRWLNYEWVYDLWKRTIAMGQIMSELDYAQYTEIVPFLILQLSVELEQMILQSC